MTSNTETRNRLQIPPRKPFMVHFTAAVYFAINLLLKATAVRFLNLSTRKVTRIVVIVVVPYEIIDL